MSEAFEPIRWNTLRFETDDANVYAPKPASFLLADVASKIIRSGDQVLDACTGSGVIGIAIAALVKGSHVSVSDINEAALEVARRNAAINGVEIETVVSSFYDKFADHRFDVVTVHPPAVPYPANRDWGLSAGMRVATDGGSDGSELVLRSIAEARRILKPGGRLLLLLPHWSNVHKARNELGTHYSRVRELARKEVPFFPVSEGKPDKALLAHVERLASGGLIDMRFDQDPPLSIVSVIEAFAD